MSRINILGHDFFNARIEVIPSEGEPIEITLTKGELNKLYADILKCNPNNIGVNPPFENGAKELTFVQINPSLMQK